MPTDAPVARRTPRMLAETAPPPAPAAPLPRPLPKSVTEGGPALRWGRGPCPAAAAATATDAGSLVYGSTTFAAGGRSHVRGAQQAPKV